MQPGPALHLPPCAPTAISPESLSFLPLQQPHTSLWAVMVMMLQETFRNNAGGYLRKPEHGWTPPLPDFQELDKEGEKAGS